MSSELRAFRAASGRLFLDESGAWGTKSVTVGSWRVPNRSLPGVKVGPFTGIRVSGGMER